MKALFIERGKIERRLKELVDHAETENRGLNAEEITEFDGLVAQVRGRRNIASTLLTAAEARQITEDAIMRGRG